MKTNIKNILKAAGVLLLGVFLGWWVFGGANAHEDKEQQHTKTEKEQTWTCSMHPQIKRAEPGDCPICGMDLIPLATADAGADPALYQMSESAMKLANVQTLVVGTGEASKSLRLSGKVALDERNTYTQSSHIPGRIEQLTINFTGEQVFKGQTIATIYSPELVTAQQELLQAAAMKESQPTLFEAAKEKLQNWRISDKQINEIIISGKVKQALPLKADVSGVVTKKMVELGDYVQSGAPIYEIADLSKLWVLFDLYEGDLGWVKEGSQVKYTIKSLPQESFEGKITFIDPLIDPQSRVATARVEVANKKGLLKPQMFVSGVVEHDVQQQGQEIIIPQSAVLWTGKRSVVYIREKGGFRMQQLSLGASLGEAYVVTEGLQAGQEIVTNAAFTIDAASELAGKPSMMSPEGGAKTSAHNHMGGNAAAGESTGKKEAVTPVAISQKAKDALKPLYVTYLDFKDALVADNLAKAQKEGNALKKELEAVNMTVFTGTSHNTWMSYSSALKDALQHIEHLKDIEAVRKVFQKVSIVMIDLTKAFNPSEQPLYVQHCPMVDSNKGADWLSTETEILNPYFGAYMLSCGEVVEEINNK